MGLKPIAMYVHRYFYQNILLLPYCMSEDNNHNNYHDSNFNLNEAQGYSLLIQAQETAFDYAIVDESRLLVYVQNTPVDELTNPRHLKSLLAANYKKVVAGLPAAALTLVPGSLYNDDQAAYYARFLDLGDNEKVLVQQLDNDNKIIYKAASSIVAVSDRFGLQNTAYAGKGTIKAIAASNPGDERLFLELGDETVQILYFKAGKLRFLNIFEFKNADELVYFTALVCDELKLKAQDVTLVLNGKISPGDANMSRLNDFYPNVELNAINVVELPGQVAAHKILSLVALSLCGSSEEV